VCEEFPDLYQASGVAAAFGPFLDAAFAHDLDGGTSSREQDLVQRAIGPDPLSVTRTTTAFTRTRVYTHH